MRYKLISTSISAEAVVYDVVNEEKNEKGEVTVEASDEPTDEYAVSITMTLQDTESLNESTFQKSITSKSHNKQTGYEVDKQRLSEIDQFLAEINK